MTTLSPTDFEFSNQRLCWEKLLKEFRENTISEIYQKSNNAIENIDNATRIIIFREIKELIIKAVIDLEENHRIDIISENYDNCSPESPYLKTVMQSIAENKESTITKGLITIKGYFVSNHYSHYSTPAIADRNIEVGVID